MSRQFNSGNRERLSRSSLLFLADRRVIFGCVRHESGTRDD